MAKLNMYLLEASAILSCFYLFYILVLSKETFFSLNRFFLISILLLSLLFPFLSFDFNPPHASAIEQPIEEISKLRMSYYAAMALWEYDVYDPASDVEKKIVVGTSQFKSVNWIRLSFLTLFIIYVIGIIVCLSRTVWSLQWIRKMIVSNPQVTIDGVKVVSLADPIAPFSFFQYVFVYDKMVDTPEFNQVLAHERIHIQEKHSIDLVIVQFMAAIFWFNPVIWQLFKSLKTTHEYIADKKIISSGYSLVEYQTLLLKQLISSNSHGLVHNFNLSFIKKRITMMSNKKSGWWGKVRVALAIAGAISIGIVLLQCNSRFEESDALESKIKSSGALTDVINLPVLPKTGSRFNGDDKDALIFSIAGNKLSINGRNYELDEIIPLIEKGGIPTLSGHIVMKIDRNQSMGFVRKVDMELRKANRRKIVYLGQTTEGESVETLLGLPPTPEEAIKMGVYVEPDIETVEAEGKIDILKINLGDNTAAVNQQKVYDFVNEHIAKQSSDYVVSLKFKDDDIYNDYLQNLVHMKEGFIQIYQERSHNMFAKDYYRLNKDEFNKVREGAPMALSIAEKEK